jgi:hypothetical protein
MLASRLVRQLPARSADPGLKAGIPLGFPDTKRLNSSRICNPASGVNKFSTVGAACL